MVLQSKAPSRQKFLKLISHMKQVQGEKQTNEEAKTFSNPLVVFHNHGMPALLTESFLTQHLDFQAPCSTEILSWTQKTHKTRGLILLALAPVVSPYFWRQCRKSSMRQVCGTGRSLVLGLGQ